MEVFESTSVSGSAQQQRRPGRPATYIFDKPESELTEEDRKLRNAVLKRRSRQNRSYYRRKQRQKKTEGGTGVGTASVEASSVRTVVDDTELVEIVPHYRKSDELDVDGVDVHDSIGGGAAVFDEESFEHEGEDIIDAVTRHETSKQIGLNKGETDAGTTTYNSEELDNDLEECLMIAVKGTMTQNTNLSRSAGVKHVLFSNLRERFSQLSIDGQEAIRSLAVFPRDFDMTSAAAVMGKDPVSGLTQAIDVLQSLFGSGFLTSTNGRFELNNVAKLFLKEEPTLAGDFADEIAGEVAGRRYIMHFQNLLSELTDPSIHKLGFARERAMQVFDVERENMNYSLELCRAAGPKRMQEFLAAGATVMRYCVDASTRMHYLDEALDTNDVNVDESGADASRSASFAERKNIVRLELARAEALCDNQSLNEAEEPLKKAMVLMDFEYTKSSGGIMDTVLVFLLLAGVKINLNNINESHKLLVEALKILNKIGLGKTTLAVNALTNLVTIYVQRGQNDMANHVATQLLDTLHAMRYECMPIYADALGVLGMVKMALREYEDAARQFGAGLEVRFQALQFPTFNSPSREHIRSLVPSSCAP